MYLVDLDWQCRVLASYGTEDNILRGRGVPDPPAPYGNYVQKLLKQMRLSIPAGAIAALEGIGR